eukprot:CAMPEP_0113964654 /NCGR_PEP_ID=MMETSP0011_2-20120614/7276_1 /TAXON_ID=101924 /ORGANISM="Rhodosorus marinus" /LENGTH=96 /DNA_ID=CAMNT_0000977013 /DNA_START=313 /DNA_END=603 /DNA_ORIENTATION=- /assembly_acc=CAM_ASM_000156
MVVSTFFDPSQSRTVLTSSNGNESGSGTEFRRLKSVVSRCPPAPLGTNTLYVAQGDAVGFRTPPSATDVPILASSRVPSEHAFGVVHNTVSLPPQA